MGPIAEFLKESIEFWLALLEPLGYLGTFLLMTIESSFIPFPSEIVMIPAGMSAAREGSWLILAIHVVAGIGGSIAGALVNYYLAVYLGRPFLLRFGRYFFVPERKLLRVEAFFAKHGEIATFVGRLIPVVRQFISIPAGLARMRLGRFCAFTGLGAGIWVIVLALFGYWIGPPEAWDTRGRPILWAMLGGVVALVIVYVLYKRWRQQMNHAELQGNVAEAASTHRTASDESQTRSYASK